MTDAVAGWHPDPFHRHAQRYWDGAQWTSDVADGNGVQTTDPAVPEPVPPAGTPLAGMPPTSTSSTPPVVPLSRVPRAALVIAGVGAVCVLLSFFVLNWYSVTAAGKSQLDTAGGGSLFSDSGDEIVPGLTAADFDDGLSWSEVRTINDDTNSAGSNDLSALSDQYAQWGWYVSLLVAAGCVAALFFRPARRWLAIAAVVMAVWHAYTANDGNSQGLTTIALGAWLGAVGLVVLAAAALVVGRLPEPQVATAQST